MLRALGAGAEEIPIELDEAARLFRSLLAGRRMLIVLDNAGSAAQIRPLLPGSSGCVVLITSRDRLAGLVASHGARRLTVDPLGTDDAVELLTRILGPERMRREPGAAASLVQACAALPLALRIAAANLDGDPQRLIAGYAAELRGGDRLAALRIEGDSQAVQTVFDTSYAALPAETRRLFRLLGLAPGPDISTGAMAAMAALPVGDVSRHFDRLAAAHLVHAGARDRFALHDLLRFYAGQRAEIEDAREDRRLVVGSLLTWYLDHACAAARVLHPHMLRLSDAAPGTPAAHFDNHTEALEWLDRERGNLVAAVDEAPAHGAPQVAWLLADVLRGYFWLRGYAVDWMHTAHAGLAAARAGGDLRGQAAANVSLAFAHYSQGRLQRAIDHYLAARDFSRQAGWQEGQATALGNIGLARATTGNLRDAAESLESAAAIDRRLGRRPGLATTLCALGLVHTRLGQPREAVRHVHEALTLYQQTGSLSGQAMALGGLVHPLGMLGRTGEAADHAARSLEIYRAVGDQDGEASVLEFLARLHHQAGRQHEALEHATAARTLIDRADRRRRVPAILNALGRIHLALGDAARSCRYHERAAAAAEPLESLYYQVEAQVGWSAALHELHRDEAALSHARRGLGLARQAGFRMLEAESLATLATIQLRAGVVVDAVS
jgi:tetratricopeptide (TPR) repeat protein